MLTFKQFLAIIAGQKRRMALIWLTIVVLVGAVSLYLPKQYTASAAVVVDIKAPDLLNNQNPLNAGWIPGYMATQVDVLGSERVAQHALRKLGLDENVLWRDQWMEKTQGRGSFETWIAQQLHEKLDIKPSRESNAIFVDYTSTDPKFAAEVANAFVRGYIATTIELRTEPTRQFATFFDERAKQLRAELEAAQQRLSAYQRQTGILARDERLDIENTRLNELSSQLVALQSQQADTSSRRAQNVADPTRSFEVLNNPVVAGLTSDLSRQQARLQELTSRLGDEHPQVIEVRASISELRRRIAAMTAQVSGGVAGNDSATRARVAQIETALAAQRAKVLKMKEQRDEIEVLMRDVENAQKAYELVLTRGSQTTLESQNAQANVSVLKVATEPAKHSSPKTTLNVAIAMVVGLIVALGYALARELLDRRVRTVEDVVNDLQVVMLAELVDTSNRIRGGAPLMPRLTGPVNGT